MAMTASPAWWQGQELPFDTTTLLSINVTWFCPVRCQYCHVRKKASLSDRTVVALDVLAAECQRARTLGVTDIRFSGGEPAALGDTLFELARVAEQAFGKKPVVLTSGIGIDEEWARKAQGLFSAIQLSVENPFAPMQTVTTAACLLDFIKKHRTTELPVGPGLTLVNAEDFHRLPQIFKHLHAESGGFELPQIGYPCHLNFAPPTVKELSFLRDATIEVFETYGYVPFYFTDFVGALDYNNGLTRRIVVNLNPDGTYGQFDSLEEGLRYKIKMELAVDRVRSGSPVCQACDWRSRCTYHLAELGQVRYDWCKMRMAIWDGILEGMQRFAERETTSSVADDSEDAGVSVT